MIGVILAHPYLHRSHANRALAANAAALAAGGLALGIAWQGALVAGLALALSSTGRMPCTSTSLTRDWLRRCCSPPATCRRRDAVTQPGAFMLLRLALTLWAHTRGSNHAERTTQR